MKNSEIHTGYEFESGMFSRVRSWVDLLPWIRLASVLRILASPIYVGSVAIAWVLTDALFSASVDTAFNAFTVLDLESDPLLPARVMMQETTRSVVFLVGLVLIWTPVVQFVGRAGASLVSTSKLPSAGSAFRLARSRCWKSYLIPIVPLGSLAAFAALLLLIRLPSLVIGSDPVSTATGWLIGLGSIPMGILGFGALFAIPLGTIAMVCEPDPDPIDSISRGYEYLYRRPLNLVFYLSVSVGLWFLARLLVGGIAAASAISISSVTMMFNVDIRQNLAGQQIIAVAVWSWLTSLAFALLGGMYLLLRRDAGGQEVEDFWEPSAPPEESLPDLPEEAYQT